jgi:hypothetical protein
MEPWAVLIECSLNVELRGSTIRSGIGHLLRSRVCMMQLFLIDFMLCKGLIKKCVVTLNITILEEGPGREQSNHTQLMNMQEKLDHRIACTPLYLGDDVYVWPNIGGRVLRSEQGVLY